MATPDTYLSTVFCTDEHIAIRAPGDFASLLPRSQVMALGTDGSIAAGTPWVLTSPSVDFGLRGVKPGHVVILTKPLAAFPGTGNQFAVSAVSGGSLTLRQVGQADGVGQPPCTDPAGLTGVAFRIGTFGPQIEDASFKLYEQFGVRVQPPGHTAADIVDLRVLRQATVCTVLFRAYMIETRTSTGDFAAKVGEMQEELREALDQCRIRWATDDPNAPTTASTFTTTRLSR